jgi:phosphatidylglycerophosphate synthase
MSEDKIDKADVYSANERAWMIRTQQARAKLFAPFLRTLGAYNVTPDHITFLSLLCGLAFCPIIFYHPPTAFALLALHVFLDGFDGPLARHLDTDSPKGSFTDSMADQAVITATTITLMYSGMIDILPGALYLITYTVVVLFAMARNVMNDPYSWLVRPRFYIYIWFVVETYWLPGTIDYLLWGFSAIMGLKVLTGYIGIRRNM